MKRELPIEMAQKLEFLRGNLCRIVPNISNSVSVFVVLLSLTLLMPKSAYAYVGPGAGLSVIGTIVALILALILAIVGFIWYPLRRLLEKLKISQEKTE